MLDRLKMTGQAMTMRVAQLETIANNLANVSTTGFKRDELFVNELEKKLKAAQFDGFLAKDKVPTTGAVIDFSQGSLKGSGRTLDVAISGEGLFVVETTQGESYTRDGRFTLNADGVLTNLGGLPILGEGGQIEIDLQQNTPSQIIINDQGEVLVDGNTIDTLRLAAVDDVRNLKKAGENLYQLAPGAAALNPAESISVRQGFVEESNVNPIYEMVSMIEVQRAYQTGQKMIQEQDRLLGRAVTEISRVNQ